MSVINSGLGWKCDNDYFVNEADAELAVISTDTAYKALQGAAITAQITNGNSTQLFLISTVENNAKLKMNTSLRTVYSVGVGGETWYISMSYMSSSVTSDFPLITASKGESLNNTTEENLVKIIAEITEAADVVFAKKIPTVDYIHQYVEGVEAETVNRVGAIKNMITLVFDSSTIYAVGDYCIYNNGLYKCTTAHTGAWSANDFTSVSVMDEIKNGSSGGGETTHKLQTVRCLHDMLTFEPMTWNGLASFNGKNVWTDGENIYYSEDSSHWILNKSTSTWTSKTWNGLTSFSGQYIWSDGENIYYSYNSQQYVLNKSTSTWNEKTWNGLTSFSGFQVWTDREKIYYSAYNGVSQLYEQYVLNKSTSTWNEKTWNGLTWFGGYYIWSDGENIYYSLSDKHYVLNKSTSTWTSKTWNGLTSFSGQYIWSDGENIYYSIADAHYKLNGSTWENALSLKTGNSNFDSRNIWTDGENIYYTSAMSPGVASYILKKSKVKLGK